MSPKRKPKPAPRRHARITPFQRLVRRGLVNVYEQTAADEILFAFAVSQGHGGQRDPALGLPTRVPYSGSADREAAWRIDLTKALHRWQRDLKGRPELACAEAVLLHERSLRDLDEAQAVRKGTSKEQMLAAVRHFAALRGNTPKGARGWRIETGKEAA